MCIVIMTTRGESCQKGRNRTMHCAVSFLCTVQSHHWPNSSAFRVRKNMPSYNQVIHCTCELITGNTETQWWEPEGTDQESYHYLYNYVRGQEKYIAELAVSWNSWLSTLCAVCGVPSTGCHPQAERERWGEGKTHSPWRWCCPLTCQGPLWNEFSWM